MIIKLATGDEYDVTFLGYPIDIFSILKYGLTYSIMIEILNLSNLNDRDIELDYSI